jgi:hypothetical protein
MNDPTFSNTLRNAFRVVGVFALGSVLSGEASLAASPEKFAGSLVGSVRDNGGVPQMGAVVQLFSRYEKLIQKVITNANGEFGFDPLPPDVYSVRVSLSSFVPALKRNIAVQAGVRSVLAINLASLLSSIELIYSSPQPGTLMSDEWKHVLRSSMSTRPVLRMIPGIGVGVGTRVDISDPAQRKQTQSSVFSDTRGMVSVTSGEANPYDAGTQQDFGTSFALATSVFGSNHVQVSGKIGYAGNSELPSTGFRTSFSRAAAGGPQVKVMMQQIAMPVRTGGLIGGQTSNAPALRTMSVTLLERTEISDDIDLEYGASLDSVTFVDRLNYLSPFARLNYKVGDKGHLAIAYSSGAPPVELLSGRDRELDPELQRDMTALAVLPRVSLRNGAAQVQRTQNMEIGYTVDVGSRTFTVGAYRETVGNAALTMSAPDGFLYVGDLLPDLSSNSSVFNIGVFRRYGYTASVTQAIGDDYAATVAYGHGGVLTTDGRTLQTADPNELRGMIERGQRHWVRGRISGVAPATKTRFVASYEWTDHRSLTPGHVYLTQRMYPETGLNLRLRQPLPGLSSLPGRLEASAELRNMLAQGYLPITAGDGRRLLLAHSPRAIRGGLSFIF